MTTARSTIPGLSLCPVDYDEGEGIVIPTLAEPIIIPESQRYGNCRIITEFEKLKTVPCGLSEIAYECKDKRTDEIRVLKKFKMPYTDGFPKSCLREVGLLQEFDHANIIRSYGVAAGKNLQSNYLILEPWVCSLEDLIEKNVDGIYDKAMVKGNMQQLFAGIGYIHECLILHRNINCDNILFTAEGVLKITGFSTSRFFSHGDMTPGITDHRYRAPELLLQAKIYTAAVDMWSAGCLLARLVLKDFLFKGSSELEILSSICKILGTPTKNIWNEFPQLLSEMEEVEKHTIFNEEISYSYLKTILIDHSLSLQNLLQDLLIYNPKGRPAAYMCLGSSYFEEEPRARSPAAMASIVRAFMNTNYDSDVNMEMLNSIQNLLVGERNKAKE